MSLAFSSLLLVLATTGCGVHFNGRLTDSVSPSSLSWMKVSIGHTSGIKVVTFTNTSTTRAVTISSVTLSGNNFVMTANTCPATPLTLAAGASCTISIQFRPLDSGAIMGTLTIVDNTATSPEVVDLTATGSIGTLLWDPSSMTFPGVAAGTISQPQTAKLINEQTTPITIAAITAGGHFAQGNNCPVSPETLGVGESCSVTITYQPSATTTGTINSAINAKDNFGNVTQLYVSGSDTGMPVVGALSFSPSTLVWGKVAVGSTAAAKTLTVTNTQSSGVSISDITPTAGFVVTATTCPTAPTVLAGGASCTVSVAFRPSVVGTEPGGLSFSDNAADSPQTVSLSGTGVQGTVIFTPTSLSFAGVAPGSVSPAQTATLTNVSTGSLTLTFPNVSGHFADTNNCPSVLAANASCTFQVTANPTTTGAITGSVNVKDSSGTYTQLYLSGQGGGVTNVLSFSPASLNTGSTAHPIDVGQTAGAKTLTVNNGQTVPLTITGIALPVDFIEQSSTCPTAPETILAGASCTVSIAFRPLSAGAKSEFVTFTDDAPGGTQQVPLTGTASTGALLFDPTSLTFAGVAVGTAAAPVSAPQAATLTNTMSTAIGLTAITVSGHFAQTNDCPASLAPNASCTFSVTSTPVIQGNTTGAINVKDDSNETFQLYLSGIGGIPIN